MMKKPKKMKLIKKIEATCNLYLPVLGREARAESSGLLVKGLGRGKEVQAIPVQLITQGDVMRGGDQTRNTGCLQQRRIYTKWPHAFINDAAKVSERIRQIIIL
jgi:hypothetical protein